MTRNFAMLAALAWAAASSDVTRHAFNSRDVEPRKRTPPPEQQPPIETRQMRRARERREAKSQRNSRHG